MMKEKKFFYSLYRKNAEKLVEEAQNLLEKTPPEDYLKEWTHSLLISKEKAPAVNIVTVIVFRLFHEWLAISTSVLKEISYRRAVHRIPHRHKKIFLGTVNLEGELQLCIDLAKLLEIEKDTYSKTSTVYRGNRMIAILKDKELWTFPVDEINGIYTWDLSKIENVPVNVSKSSVNYLRGIFKHAGKTIGLLDEELLFYSLRKNAL